MSRLSPWMSGSSTLLIVGLAAGAIAPIVICAPATAANFVDIQSHWARPFIEALAEENLINGYSDRTFRPDQPVTRAQFAAMIQQAFDENNIQLSREFDQAAADYWIS
ncbi:MAG: S-layer homology domain-containing protein, partial [Cyanobacteriota bacterium]